MKSNNQINIPEARAAMDKFKMEAASEVGVNLKEGYNGDLTSREAGSVGGQMVKKMIEAYEQNLKYEASLRRAAFCGAPQVYRRLSKTPQDSTYASAPTLSLKINQKGWPLC